MGVLALLSSLTQSKLPRSILLFTYFLMSPWGSLGLYCFLFVVALHWLSTIGWHCDGDAVVEALGVAIVCESCNFSMQVVV